MDAPGLRKDTAAWMFQVWTGFVLSVGFTSVGVLTTFLVEPWTKGYLAMGLLFTVGSCFSLAKTVRDNHEASKRVTRISDAKAEKILTEDELDGGRGAPAGGMTGAGRGTPPWPWSACCGRSGPGWPRAPGPALPAGLLEEAQACWRRSFRAGSAWRSRR